MTPEVVNCDPSNSFDQIELSKLQALVEVNKALVEVCVKQHPNSEFQKMFEHITSPNNIGRIVSVTEVEEDSNKRSAWIGTLNGVLEKTETRVYTVSEGRAVFLHILEPGNYYQLPNIFEEEDYPMFLKPDQREAWVRLQTVIRAPSEEKKERTLRTALTPHENILLNLSLTNSQQRAFFWVILMGISEFEKVKKSYHEIDNRDHKSDRFLHAKERRDVKENLRLLALNATRSARSVGAECEFDLLKPSVENKLLTSSYELSKLKIVEDFVAR